MSLYIRLKMKESPIFEHIKSTGMASAKPIVDAFTNPQNRKRLLISLFGATAGQGVIWYTGQFYALFYMQTILKIERQTAAYVIAFAIILAIPLFVAFGALSDRIGRKKIMMAGCLLAVLAYYPIYQGMAYYAGNEVAAIQSTADVVTGKPKLSPVTRGWNSNNQCSSKPECADVDAARFLADRLCNNGLRTNCRVLGRSISGEGSLHLVISAIPYRQRGFWRAPADNWSDSLCLDGKYLCGALVSDDHRVPDIRNRFTILARNARS